jgi:hypothetical protein
MIFNFNFNNFTTFYQTLSKIQSPITWEVFSKNYYTIGGITNYNWIPQTVKSEFIHPYLPNLYITFKNNKYTFFNIPIEINNILYGNHFSVGYKKKDFKSKNDLIDLHYTIQDPITQESYNDETKCWLYDNQLIDTNLFYTKNCIVPANKTYSNVYNDLFISYIIVILATPFIQNPQEENEIKDIARRLIASNSQMNKQPVGSPAGGKKKKTKIYTGPRGGKYILINNKKKYLKI